MLKVAPAGEDHRHAMLVAGGDDFFVFHRATGLDDRGDAGFGRFVNSVAEWEEGVGSDDASLTSLTGLFRGNLCRVQPAHLASPNTDSHAVFRVEDRVRLHMFADQPAKAKVD